MIDVLGIDPEIASVPPDMCAVLVPAQGFPHIERVLSHLATDGVVAVVIDHTSVHTISANP